MSNTSTPSTMYIAVAVVILVSSVTDVKGTMCYICSDVQKPTDCVHVGQCPNNQQCHIRKYASTLNIFSYDIGCQTDSFCNSLGKRQTETKRQTDIVVWNRCCTTDFCNIDYDEHGFVKNHTGLRCFECNNVRDPADCSRVITCEGGDVCATYEELNGLETSYDMSCESRRLCESSGYFIPFGRRRHSKRRDLCRACCDIFSHCNSHFCSVFNNDTIVPAIGTSPPPSTTPQPFLQILKGPTTHVVNPGETVSFDCEVIGQPPPVITWEHLHNGLDNPVTSGVITTQKGSRLTISNVQSTDEGTYTCVAANAVGDSSKSAQLTVGAIPKIGTVPSEVHGRFGENITIPCQVSGSPKPSVHWDIHTASGDHRYPIGIIITLDNSLVIRNLTQEHIGTWICKAINSIGEATASVKLTVT